MCVVAVRAVMLVVLVPSPALASPQQALSAARKRLVVTAQCIECSIMRKVWSNCRMAREAQLQLHSSSQKQLPVELPTHRY